MRETEECAIDVSTSQRSQAARETWRTSRRAYDHPALLLAVSSAAPAYIPLATHCVLDGDMHPTTVNVGLVRLYQYALAKLVVASGAVALSMHANTSLHALQRIPPLATAAPAVHSTVWRPCGCSHEWCGPKMNNLLPCVRVRAHTVCVLTHFT